MSSLSGTKLGNYRIGEKFDSGGMAEIYAAFNRKTSEQAVLKTIHWHLRDRKEIKARFQQEIQTASQLKHENIIPVYYAGALPDGRPYVIMPYIGGGSLEQWIEQKRFESEKGKKYLVSILSQTAAALDYAHQHGVVHRDIKPANVLLTEKGFAVLTDFGIARAMQAQSSLTNPDQPPGTPVYMAPEQIKQTNIGPWTDIYALGVVLYEMLTGQAPFKGETASILYQQVHDAPPPLQKYNPQLPRVQALDKIIKKAMDKDPRKRYKTAGQMASAVRQIMQPQTGAQKTGKNTPAWTPIMTMGGVALALLLGLLVFFKSPNKTGSPVGLTPSSPVPASPSATTVATVAPPVLDPSGTPTATPNSQLSLGTPKDNAVFAANSAVTLNWNWPGLQSGQQYHLIVQGQRGREVDETMSQRSFGPQPFPAGAYSWMVLVETKNDAEIARSAPRHFIIQSPTSTPPPPNTNSPTSPGASSGGATGATGETTPPGDPLPSPKLLQPENGESFYGLSRPVSFEWSPANRPLAANEYYVLAIKHNRGTDFTWLKNPSYTIGQDKEWLKEKGPNLEWRVVVANAQTSDPNSAQESPVGKEVGAYSETRAFVWDPGN